MRARHGLFIIRNAQSQRDKIKTVVQHFGNIKFARNAEMRRIKFALSADGVSQNAPRSRETSWEQSLLWLQV